MDYKSLPVYEHKDVIIDSLRDNRVVVVESPTGSGKTTQIPKILYDAGFAGSGRIGVTQPRRIAALSVSHYIAGQYNTAIPGLVGYKMRFVDETVPDTRMVIMTDGILLQELKTDPLLSEYSIIMVDEAHERSLNIDFILGLLKDVLRQRDDLKVVVSSATINAEVFSEYFDECPIVSIDAKMYPVKVVYDPPEVPHDPESILNKIGEIVKRIISGGKQGDILIFLSGERQIKECISYLSDLDKGNKNLELLPLYSRLSQQEQERVFYDFPGKRKIVVATNIAETSVTIDGIVHVIDPGFSKLNFYNPNNYTSSLIEVPISRASCNQRKGRAGRTAPGVCYRLYTQEDYNQRQLFTTEEIYRQDLSEVVLRMAELGIKDFEHFDFISNPGYKKILNGVEVLRLLEAIDENRQLTAIGQMMIRFPIIPRISRMIVAAIYEYPNVLEEVLIAGAFLNGKTPFLLPHGLEMEARKAHHSFRHKLGDFVSYLKIYRAYVKSSDKEDFCNSCFLDYKEMKEIYNVKNQLQEIVSEMKIPVTSGGGLTDYLCAVSKGLVQFVCMRKGRGTYSSPTAYGIKIHPGSVMYKQRPQLIVAGEIMKTSQMYAMSVSPLKPEWLERISPEVYSLFFEKKKKRRKPAEARRNYTNFIKIGGETFKIKFTGKKRKTVIFPYEKLKRVLSSVNFLQDYKGLKGKVVLDGYELLTGMNLNRIFYLVPKIHGTENILTKWPKNARFEYLRDAHEIVRYVPYLLYPCKKARSKNKLGFLTLLTNGDGMYWYTSYRDIVHAADECISSLEYLFDENINILNKDQEKVINEAYRRVSEIMEE
ncbi:MAG: helicase-related protein [Spirochaetota bacterium]